MHLKRWITAIIAIPTLILIIGPGPSWGLLVLLWAVSVAGLIEFYGITATNLPMFVRWSNYLLTALLLLVIYMRQTFLVPLVIVLCAFVPMAFYMITHPFPRQQWTADISKSLLGPVYVGIPLAMLIYIDRHYASGDIWVLFLVTVIFSGDTGAFYCGKAFGRHKLYEAVSPKKTWEGAFGGLVGSLVGALLFLYILAALFKVDLHPFDPSIIILALSLSALGQIGDLTQSMLKRNHGVKDAGIILPGHGGVLDRLDALLFAIPLLYIYIGIYLA
jgi:phosphatidate cytidylyltransferase